MSEILVTTFADRPNLIDQVEQMADTWPEFMQHDPVANALLWQVVPTFPHLCVVATDHRGAIVARGRAIPFRLWSGDRGGVLPDGGWDRVLIWGIHDHANHEAADTVSALEVAVAPHLLGNGLSSRMLEALRTATARAGLAELVAPVRPTEKHRRPRASMGQYLQDTRADGLPRDPWLRVHARIGGRVHAIAPTSMVISGTLDQWRSWTDLPFDADGPTEVPGALQTVRVDLDNDHATYVEPNVWIRHRAR